MPAIIVEGTQLAPEQLNKIESRVASLKQGGYQTQLDVIIVGEDPASLVYVGQKEKRAKEVGIEVNTHNFAASITSEELAREVKRITKNSDADGLIVQLPLPKSIERSTVLEALDPERDVDGLTPTNIGRLIVGKPAFLPPTPAAVLHILHHYQIDWQKKDIVIVGGGVLVGRPLANLLLQKEATVTVIQKHIKDLSAKTITADILISGTGQPGIIKKEMIKPGAIVIDTGFSRVGNEVQGDVVFEDAKNKASLISPVPGGVGALTVSFLLDNVVKSAEKRANPATSEVS